MTAPSPEAARRQKVADLAICIGLILLTFAVYAQVSDFEFLDFDDYKIIYQNEHVLAGLTPASITWALTGVVTADWMPVTLLSHMLDAQLFGMQPGLHHLENVLIHAMSCVLLFLVLQRATRAQGPSAFVAFVFALHPLHVESVAWVSERKDVLSAFFWFLALFAYVRYTERPSRGRYLLIVGLFCLGLMSKPMLVTFPFTLLLLDVWPLRRFQWPKVVWEKLPLFALTAAASVVTYLVQKSGGAVVGLGLAARISNIFNTYAIYLGQMFWPARLACLYEYPQSISAWRTATSIAVVVAVSALTILVWRTRPYLAVGWFWYLGTLVPVIGVVRVGYQAHADRYMYIPMVGLLMMLAWGAADIVAKWPRTKPVIAAAAVACCAACMAVAWKQTAYWKNTETLFEHAIDVTEDHGIVEKFLAVHLLVLGREADAIPHFEAILRVKPDDGQAQNDLGVCLIHLGDCAAAIPHLEAAIRAGTPFREAEATRNFNLGGCLITTGNYAGAIPYLEAAIRDNPGLAAAHFGLGTSFSKIPGHAADAIREYEAALRLTPDDAQVHASLGQFLASLGRAAEAIPHLEAAQRVNPTPAISEILDRLRAGGKVVR